MKITRWFFLSLILPISVAVGAEALPAKVDYNRDIKSILSNNCYACHGPDASHRKADLRFDSREGALADLDGYAAIVPGAPGRSELLTRITADDEEVPTSSATMPGRSSSMVTWLQV